MKIIKKKKRMIIVMSKKIKQKKVNFFSLFYPLVEKKIKLNEEYKYLI